VPTKAIKLDNAKLANVTPCSNRTRPHLMLTPAQRYKVGKRALDLEKMAPKIYALSKPNLE